MPEDAGWPIAVNPHERGLVPSPQDAEDVIIEKPPVFNGESCTRTWESTRSREIALRSAVEQEIRELIQQNGRITFAQFMQACLYSPNGGFYSARDDSINAHFGTSSSSHPVFGTLIARQLEQMWRLLGEPPVFYAIEVGSGDGLLAQSIADACGREAPRFAETLYYVAADYQPGLQPHDGAPDSSYGVSDRATTGRPGPIPIIQRVRTEGLGAFQNVVGCILCNELIDNFPVHRFAIQDGRVKEVYVTVDNGSLTEVLDEPSTPRIEERLASLDLTLPDMYRGEVNLAMENWIAEISRTLDRGFVLTIDYGELASDLYSPDNAQGTLVCFDRHAIGSDPYQRIGQQDITCQVDFTTLMGLGERYSLTTAGYARQSEFLENLGFTSSLDALDTQGLSAARTELHRIVMMTLVDPAEYGDFKVLAQSKGVALDSNLLGFSCQQIGRANQ